MVRSGFIRFNWMTLDLSSVGASPNDTVECVVVVTDPSGTVTNKQTFVYCGQYQSNDRCVRNPAELTLNDTLSCYAESTMWMEIHQS